MALALMTAPFVFVFFLIRGLRRQLRKQTIGTIVTLDPDALSSDLRQLRPTMESLGFFSEGPALFDGKATRWQPFTTTDRGCLASLCEKGRAFSTRTWDFDSRLRDGRWVMTFNDPAALSLPSHPEFLIQVFPRIGIAELFQHHQEALRALEAVGLASEPITGDPQTVTLSIARTLYQRATMAMAASILWRSVSKRSPHAVPLAARFPGSGR